MMRQLQNGEHGQHFLPRHLENKDAEVALQVAGTNLISKRVATAGQGPNKTR
jgi:hypothetical protein